MKIKNRFTKLVAATLTLCLLLSLVCLPNNMVNAQSSAYQQAKSELQLTATATRDYYVTNNKELDIASHTPFNTLYCLVQSGIDCNSLYNASMDQVKSRIVDNKLCNALKQEDFNLYAEVILLLKAKGQDPTNFNGINLLSRYSTLLDSKDAAFYSNATTLNPYYLIYHYKAIKAYKANITNAQAKLDAITDGALVNTISADNGESGFDYWGINVDNNGQMMPVFADRQKEVKYANLISNTTKWNKTQANKQNQIVSWRSASISSTGLMLVYESTYDYDEAATYFKALTSMRLKDGSYPASAGSTASNYTFATPNALQGLVAYYQAVAAHEKTSATTTQKPATQNAVVKNTLSVSTSKVTLYTKKATSAKVTAKATGKSTAVAAKTSNAKVATVKNSGNTFVITAKAKGTATITFSANGLSKAVKVTVKKPSITLKKKKATIKKGKKYNLAKVVKVAPTAKITYKSSKKSIATVSKKGVIKAKKKGTVTIKVTALKMTKKFKFKVK